MESSKAEIRVQFNDVPGDIFKCTNLTIILLFHKLLFILNNSLCDFMQTKILNSDFLHYLDITGKKQGRNEFVIKLQPSESMYMKLAVSLCLILFNLEKS